MGRNIKDDLCSSCLNITCRPIYVEDMVISRGGETVGEALARIYSSPKEWVEVAGNNGVYLLLYKTIIQGDGCTNCGEKVLDLSNTYDSSTIG